jgi:hypothetical protein
MDGYGGPEAFVTAEMAGVTTAITLSVSFLAKLSKLEIEGTAGSIRGSPGEYTQFEYKKTGGEWRTIRAPGSAEGVDIAQRLLGNFCNTIMGREELLIDASSAVAPITVIDAIYDSAVDILPKCYQEWVA